MKLYSINKTFLLLCIAFAVFGCAKEDLVKYKEDPRVYFSSGEAVEYSFVASPQSIIKDTLFIPIRIMGSAVNRDRTFNINLDDSSTAREGYHFEFGPKVIPAGAYETELPVYIYRRAGLKDSSVIAYFTIGVSDDFKDGYNDKAIGLTAYTKLHYSISINDQLLMPSNWVSKWGRYFGDYSKVKHSFINQVYGSAGWATSVIFPQDINFLVQSVKFALYNYEQANGPLLDENGHRVIFP